VRAAGAEIRKRLLREPIEPAGFGVPLDGLIKTRGLEILKPRTKSHQLVRHLCGAQPRGPCTNGTEKLVLRLSLAAKQTLQAAAAGEGKSVNEFVLDTALKAAEECSRKGEA
jgi:hypothetical protein